MKSILMSIQPKWCKKIISGEKTIDIRKTAPKQQSRSQASNSVLNPSTPKPTAVEQQWLNDDDSDMDLPF